MPRQLLVGSLVLMVGILSAAQQVVIKKVPMSDTSPASGHQMYLRYCAACHGPDARGNGPAAPALRTRPADLTALARTNKGKFPALRVSNAILGDTASSAHPNRDMPDWGSFFESLAGSRPGTPYRPEVQLRVANLNRYLKSVQEPPFGSSEATTFASHK